MPSKIFAGQVLDLELTQFAIQRNYGESDWEFRKRGFAIVCRNSRHVDNLQRALDILYEDFLAELQNPRSKFYDPVRLAEGFHEHDPLESRTTRKRFIAQKDPIVLEIENLARISRTIPPDAAR